jgi:hypothetical protein
MITHLKKEGCHIKAITSVNEDTWNEFEGTFYDGDTSHHGIAAEGQCACGLFKGRLRVEKPVVEIIKDVVNNY